MENVCWNFSMQPEQPLCFLYRTSGYGFNGNVSEASIRKYVNNSNGILMDYFLQIYQNYIHRFKSC